MGLDNQEAKVDTGMRTGLLIMGGALVLVFLVAMIGFIVVASRPRQSKPVRAVDPAKQEQRRELIADTERLGGFTKVVDFGGTGNAVDLWVGPKFYTLNFEQKSNLIGVVWDYYFEGKGKTMPAVRVLDNYTGKEVGMYFEDAGLKLY